MVSVGEAVRKMGETISTATRKALVGVGDVALTLTGDKAFHVVLLAELSSDGAR